ncbi:zinc finger AN1 domain-containing stress-associated protein 15-like [Iris pallida]|uniref:Zinc finger AN1 domain-containing stress-associated protein 15-like n=1 Tax=Iris pallida TaxID=29817 RepID=A0AAX6EXG7_IRIPA|nr:zinc finger AN1 domain-containing stress-associated protein 15-like [Iris pallida]
MPIIVADAVTVVSVSFVTEHCTGILPQEAREAGGGPPRGAEAVDAGGEPVLDLPEEGGADRLPVPVRAPLLRAAPLLGRPQVLLRLQGHGQGGDLQGQPPRQSRQDHQDLSFRSFAYLLFLASSSYYYYYLLESYYYYTSFDELLLFFLFLFLKASY